MVYAFTMKKEQNLVVAIHQVSFPSSLRFALLNLTQVLSTDIVTL